MGGIKSRTVRISSLEEFKALVTITSKPYTTFVSILLVSLYLIMMEGSRMYGILFASSVILIMILVKDRVILKAADRFVLIYDPMNKDLATRIYLSEVEHWEYIANRETEELVFTLDDGEVIRCGIKMTGRLMRYLRDKIESKEIKHKRRLF